ncbi:probable magnesium transporter NIPA9 isoform X1 [Musa acuminata AAA Group]|uniref:probable magnesium transporter NIPA9 isoform X1 n=1 Tax=Musa acuminata AAA Group TaxID=214697 RepID=UPI0031DAF2B6
MWESICLTLMATAGNNIGKVLQKKGTVILPPLSFKLKVISAYISNKLWVVGFLMDISGAILMLRALSQAPVSVIQPVSGCGLAILCVFSHFYLKEVMNALDWVGIALAGAGTIGVGFGGEEQNGSIVSLFHLPLMGFSVALLFVGSSGYMAAHLQEAKARSRTAQMHSEVIEEIIFGLESGILFGMASVISKMGFVFSEQGFSKIVVPICISISICCSATGFVYQTRGLKHGRAIVVSTCAAVASIVTGVLAGMLALGEHMPTSPVARVTLLLGWLFIILGVILLVSSTRLMALLPRPIRRHLRSNLEKNQNLRRSGSVRAKDPSPSAVIQASTLHHLVTSPAKEKA